MGHAIQSLSNEPGPGLRSAGPCMTVQAPGMENGDGTKTPYWLSIRDAGARLCDKLCDFTLYNANEKHNGDCLDIYAKGLISPSEIMKNGDGSYACTSQKELSQLNGIYVALHDEKTGRRTDRVWIHNKKAYANRTLGSLSMEIREASRRKYYPKYLYLLSAIGDVTGRRLSDFTLYSKQSIPDMGLDVIRITQAEVPAIYRQPDGTYRCTDETLRLGNDGAVAFREVDRKSPWHKATDIPSHELCLKFKNQFIAWDGKNTYLASFDEYDGIFRKPVDIGGIPRNKKDDHILAWACLPVPPSKEWALWS